MESTRMEVVHWNQELRTAISTYDFEKMKESLKNGAEIDNMILHRVINYDRIDLLEYFLFSPELPKHCDINYEYEFFGKNAAFVYACACNSIECAKFMLRDSRVSHFFKMEDCAYRAFQFSCTQGSTDVFYFLTNSPETKDFCNLSESYFKEIKSADSRNRVTFLTDLIMNLDYQLVEKMKPLVINCESECKPAFLAREIKEQLSQNPQSIKLNKKI